MKVGRPSRHSRSHFRTLRVHQVLPELTIVRSGRSGHGPGQLLDLRSHLVPVLWGSLTNGHGPGQLLDLRSHLLLARSRHSNIHVHHISASLRTTARLSPLLCISATASCVALPPHIPVGRCTRGIRTSMYIKFKKPQVPSGAWGFFFMVWHCPRFYYNWSMWSLPRVLLYPFKCLCYKNVAF